MRPALIVSLLPMLTFASGTRSTAPSPKRPCEFFQCGRLPVYRHRLVDYASGRGPQVVYSFAIPTRRCLAFTY